MTRALFANRGPQGGRWRRPELAPAWLALLLTLYCSVFLNHTFWVQLLQTQTGSEAQRWTFFAAVFGAITAFQFACFNLVFTRWTSKPVLAFVALTAIAANYFSVRYGVHYNTDMMRNIFETHPGEASELLGLSLWLNLLGYGLPVLLLLMWVRVRHEGWGRAIWMRLGLSVLALVLSVGCVMPVFKNFSATMRNHKEIRHLILPSSYLLATSKLWLQKARPTAFQAIGLDARLGSPTPGDGKPLLVVMVVGETARVTNWGLSGYARATTPELSELGVLNFPYAVSCGTNTEVSVPCMFSPYGRRHYDEDRIRSSESLLHVLRHAGVEVQWIDNQSGCKGVCKGLPVTESPQLHPGKNCGEGECLDDALVTALKSGISVRPVNQMIVLHQLGNHGPAYHARYPKAFERFKPACQNDDLAKCSQEEIVNAYDNALLYTDHLLASMIGQLASLEDRHVLFLYVSDHGESLGERGLYLHGMPYAIAPDVQTRVPLVVWSPPKSRQPAAWSCMAQRAKSPASHDNLFHTILGLYGVQTSVYDAEMDLFRGCRG